MGRSACVCTHAIGWKTEGLEGAAPEACSSISTASVDPEPSIIGRCRHALAELGLAPPQSEALTAYLQKLQQYLAANGAYYHDDRGDVSQPLAVYADGDHLKPEERVPYTDRFAELHARFFQ